MRIIGGKMRGTKLFTLEGYETTRPTLDRVKEALFNIISVKIVESVVLDLFSGSGALGIESISRGANKVFLCDESKRAIDIIKKNVSKTRCENQSVIFNKNNMEILQYFKSIGQKFDIVFLDPPYKTDLAEISTQFIIENDLLENEGIIIIETDNQDKVKENLEDKKIEIFDIRKYGRVFLFFLKRKG